MYRRIVVPLDGSELAERALPDAEGLARVIGVPLHLVRAVEPANLSSLDLYGVADYGVLTQALVEEQTSAQEYLERTASALAERGLVATTDLRQGRAATEIVASVEPGDLIVIASHGRGGMARWFLGSVAEEVARRSSVPVLLVRAAPNTEPARSNEAVAVQ